MGAIIIHGKQELKAWALSVFVIVLLALSGGVAAASITLDEDEEYGKTRWGLLPFVFSTDSLGTAYGVGGFISGVNQPQSSLTAAAFSTSNDSWLVAASLRNFRFDGLDRWFFDIFALNAHYTDQRFYESPGRLSGTPAGSNDSLEDDFILASATIGMLRLTSISHWPLVWLRIIR